jgi:tetratricopeptide (TPR) repeat protein
MADSYFAELADVHKTPGNDIAELQQLEVRRLRAASKCMLEAGKGTVPANDQARREIVEKSSLIALLAVPDEAWSGEDVKALPEWVRRDQNLAMLELLALHIKRPQTAYQVSLHAAVVPANTGTAKETYAQYLSRSAESLKKSHEYDLAVYCLQTGLASFAGRKEPDATAELRCQLATVLDAMGHPELAVEQTQQALADGGVSALRGKLAAMQLMYLYRARRFSDVTKEGPVYMRDPKCEAYMPYVLYVQWLALRSQDEMEQAGKVQREFLSKFASHSLAADMYYASAIDAINQGNLEGASQFLDRVDGLDPNLLWKPKVRSLRESIKQMRQVESK